MTFTFHEAKTKTKEFIFVAEPDFGQNGTITGKLSTKSQEAAVFPSEIPFQMPLEKVLSQMYSKNFHNNFHYSIWFMSIT